jgi:hypothetical protein
MDRLTLAVSLTLAFAAAACSHDTDGASRAEGQALARSGAALEIEKGGTFMFRLDESPRVSGIMKAKCVFSGPSCYGDIAREAAKEGVRFSRNAKGELVYTSFGEGETYLEAPFRIVTATETEVAALPIGELPKGAPKGGIKIEILPGGKLAMVDPVKGRLVYDRVK